jgi:hypothetical protein
MQHHIHNAGGGKGETLMFTLLTVERDAISRPPLEEEVVEKLAIF